MPCQIGWLCSLLGPFCIPHEFCNPLSIFPSRRVFSSLNTDDPSDGPERGFFKSRTAFHTLLTPVGNEVSLSAHFSGEESFQRHMQD